MLFYYMYALKQKCRSISHQHKVADIARQLKDGKNPFEAKHEDSNKDVIGTDDGESKAKGEGEVEDARGTKIDGSQRSAAKCSGNAEPRRKGYADQGNVLWDTLF
ncbi:unnamed protein product [Toxocara canis]|uniref:Ovule protein n=1 Tax=Toxocara canis TaxID=6265 RepID=A0A183V9J4_TOXCA|nr:unnamed protein product [Toxocara canis]